VKYNKELNYEQNVIRPAGGRTAAIELELEPFIEDRDTRSRDNGSMSYLPPRQFLTSR
jgi:hypothetical protein